MFSFLFAMPFAGVLAGIIAPRHAMKRRAQALLAQYPDAERISVFLTFNALWGPAKQREMDATIAEMSSMGWIYLRATEANPWRTIRTWGGGLILHFLRPRPWDTRICAAKPGGISPGLTIVGIQGYQ